jgi:hypothetical protein
MREVREVATTYETVPGVSRSISVEAAARLAECSPSTVRVGPRGMFRIPPDAVREWIRPAAER